MNTKCSNCGATITADEIPRGACKFCGAAIQQARPAVGTVGAQVDDLLASLGIQPGTPAMQHIQTFLATQQSFSAGGMIYRTLADMPPEARRVLMASLLAQHQAMMGAQAPGAAFGPRPVARRRSSGCGCFFALMVLAVAGGIAAYFMYYVPR